MKASVLGLKEEKRELTVEVERLRQQLDETAMEATTSK
jgi:regulator of replication initiation timing